MVPYEGDEDDNADRTGGFGKVFMDRILEEHHAFLNKKM
ncbi:hypothetical protein DDE82_004303 [Stemphylium lycopersici]|uniref:Uncharacterized protein n=1 Tax=Stemphylium lycopersici TaxID=183478 RepID=A0A364NAP8_STELY|nr:hypothetical protein TW65_06493 [Stemphylium lycopersici]RAR04825.1 hypothetical protein DDE82_004303 [Stemphylium lycopersici]RAR14111.1 hypothetical protein DDE83_002529 [Stemphylium lycopersici]